MKAEEKIYYAYYSSKQSRLYYAQLKEYTALSHSSLQNALQKCISHSVLTEIKTKGNTFYEIRDKPFFQLEYSFIAQKKYQNLSQSVRIPLTNFLHTIPKNIFTIILFGSASRNEEKKGSDIDILIVSNEHINYNEAKKEFQSTSKYPLSLFTCTIEEYINANDDIIIQAKKTGFPIYKEQNFYEVQLDEL